MKQHLPLSLLFGALAVLTPTASATRAGKIAEWDFSNNTITETVSGLKTQQSKASKGVQAVDGALLLDNKDKGDGQGVALVIEDSPILTGHDEGGSGYTSLVLKADVMLNQTGEQVQVLRKTDGDIGYQLYIRADGRVTFYIKTERGVLRLTSKNRIAADGKWHHIEAIWDSSEWLYDAQLAVDGVVSWASAPKLGALTDTSSPLTIGGFYRSEGNIGQRLDGKVDNVSIAVGQPELFKISGRPNPDSGPATGAHLLSQPGLLSAGFIVEEAPTPESHGGTLAQNADGTLLSVWFGGTREGHIDSGVWLSELDNGNWSQPRKIAHATYPNNTLSATFNPVLFQYPDGGPLLLFYLGGQFNMSFLTTSDDGGKTWNEPQRLAGKIRGASKNKPVLLADGTLICPDNGGNRLKFDRTRDQGKSWLPSSLTPPSEIDAIQPTILTHRDGRLQALARSHTGVIVQSWSSDNGQTWSPLEKTELPNNYSGIDAVTLRDGRHVLIYNHVGIPEGRWGGARTPLNIAISDDGIKWYAALVLEDEPGEFSYPVVIEDSDGMVHALYTWNRVRMKHAKIDPSALTLREIKDGVWPK